MRCPLYYPAEAIDHSLEAATPYRTWLSPVIGLALAIGGFILGVAGMPVVTAPPSPAHGVETLGGAVDMVAERLTTPPRRLTWTQTRLAEWSQSREHGRSPSPPSATWPCAGSDHADGSCAVAAYATNAHSHLPKAWIGRNPVPHDPIRSFAGRDLRRILVEMTSAQRGVWTRHCPCPMVMAEQGSR